MTSLLQVWLVKYKCPCLAWFPLCQLQFCRKCSQLKCPLCVIEEIDIIFCPNCLENTTTTEASQRRYRCPTCQECPSCGNLLGVRSQADLYYLQCNACQWTTRDLGIPDRPSSNEQWPEPANPLEEELGKVLNLMKGLSTYERLERDRKTQTTKRLSNLGILQNDHRYALQNAYNLRKKALNQRPEPTESFHLLAPSADVPELDPSYLTEKPDPGKIDGLCQILSHPLSGKDGELYPTKVKMNSRRALRCKCCDTMLYKGELSPNVVKPRLQCFALDSFPEIRISRPIHLVSGQSSAFFITITNNTLHTINLKLAGQKCENDVNCVDTSNFVMEMKIPTKENIEDNSNSIEGFPGSEYAADPNETNSRILYIRRNRAGICVECFPREEIKIADAFALLNFTFTSQSETPNFIFNGEVKIKMDA